MLKQYVGVSFDDKNVCLHGVVTLLWHASFSKFRRDTQYMQTPAKPKVNNQHLYPN